MTSVIDIVQEHLDDRIWDITKKPELLHPEVKKEILKRLFGGLRQRNFVRYDLWITGIYFVGSVATLQFSETSDLDIRVEVDKLAFNQVIGEVNWEKLKQLMVDISGDYYSKTLHPINFYVVDKKLEKAHFDAIYDILADKWVKYYPQLESGKDLSEMVPELYQKSITIMEILDDLIDNTRRQLIDIQLMQDILGTFSGVQQRVLLEKIRRKLVEVEKYIEEMTTIFIELKRARDEAYKLEEFDDSGFLALHFSKAWLPPNIVFKFLERYGYIGLLKELKKALKEKDVDKYKELLLGI